MAKVAVLTTELARQVRDLVNAHLRHGPDLTTSEGQGPQFEDPTTAMCIVAQNGGSDGTYDPDTNTGTRASWSYDLYLPGDTDHVQKLNDSPLQPKLSAARVTIGPVVPADDDTFAMMGWDGDGAIVLLTCAELVETEACS